MKLHELSPARGSKKRHKRLGCGRGSGHGKTCTRGHKGQLSRAGSTKSPGFEGGQMPLYRRMPKRGFKSLHHKTYSLVNLDKLDSHFEDGAKVDPNILIEKGIIKKRRSIVRDAGVKILGRGHLTKKLSIEGCTFSKSAKEKIK